MWFFRWLILAVLFLVLLAFGFQNAALNVDGLRVGSTVVPEAPLLLVLLAAFLVGLVVMFIIASVEYFRMLTKLRRVTRERDALSSRLQVVQQLPLDEVDKAFGSDDRMGDGGGG
jgi:putative membrane protein